MGSLAAIVGSLAAILGVSNSLGYLLPAIIGLESMGIPSPGETALVAAAVLASQGKLEIWLVILIGVCSAIVGDNIGYLLGRRFGRSVFTAPGPFMHHRIRAIRAGDGFFERHGPKAVFLGRWIALVRFATAWLAGINRMPFKQFFFWNALGGITWGVTYGLVGYFGGEAAAHVLAEAGIIGLVVLLILPGVIYAIVKRRERRMADRSDPGSAERSG
jgi:membrane protein DedA with SNARE-associated domain